MQMTSGKERNLFSRALTHGRKNQPRRRKMAAEHKPAKTLCRDDKEMLACIAVFLKGEIKAVIWRAF